MNIQVGRWEWWGGAYFEGFYLFMPCSSAYNALSTHKGGFFIKQCQVSAGMVKCLQNTLAPLDMSNPYPHHHCCCSYNKCHEHTIIRICGGLLFFYILKYSAKPWPHKLCRSVHKFIFATFKKYFATVKIPILPLYFVSSLWNSILFVR